MKKLTLKADRLAQLDTDDMARIASGAATRICVVTDPCITWPVTGLGCLLTRDACS